MISNGDESQKVPLALLASSNSHGFFKNNAVAIYTLLGILVRVKNTLGLEAMLEYIEHYQKLIERHNPEFKEAVEAALGMVSVEKLYKDIAER